MPDWFRPVYYASQRLSSAAEKNYLVTEHEALGMVYAVDKFWHYLLGNKFTFHVDHSALVYLVAKQDLHGKFARWMLILTEFKFTVIHMPGKEHAVADFLSLLEVDDLAEDLQGQFAGCRLICGHCSAYRLVQRNALTATNRIVSDRHNPRSAKEASSAKSAFPNYYWAAL